MKKITMLSLLGLTGLLAACGSQQEASKSNFEKAINDAIGEQKVCLPVGLATHDDQGAPSVDRRLLGDKEIRIPTQNADGDKINQSALKQMAVLVDAKLYEEGEKAEIASGQGDKTVPVAVFYRTQAGDKQMVASPNGSLLCLGTPKVDKVELFTEPTPANGVTVSKVVYEAKLVPEKWASKLLKAGDEESAKILDEPQRESATLVLTNQGWRDARALR
ncbi:hypothetical protein [Snodgrassella sp. CFCC 13594]|uniref:hypothetical protein n=1 Tax=Snodgrassella sp. CFCC 13594 TaxID=1775559 RepID=UPI00082CC265|nr:hypothetical protein [Snodgrassella sp. CFCC 13594]